MAKKLRVGIIGATGMVGQNYINLLRDHPWFEVVYVASSKHSYGKKYSDAVIGRWQMPNDIPSNVKDLMIEDGEDVSKAIGKVDLMFGAMDLDTKELTQKLEFEYAKAGIPMVSNTAANRWTVDVPMLIPEINHDHLKLIDEQKKNRKLKSFVAVKPNCSLQSYLTPIYALEQAGFKVDKLIITTLQAVSGAGYPGVASLDIIDNIIPFIGGEDDKTENEPSKILGKVENGKLILDKSIKISATCTRVPVINGHTACVSLKFKNKKPSKEEILKVWKNFKSLPQELSLPFAPKNPIIYLEQENRPQPRKDRDNDKAMAVTVGRLRDCNVFDYKFVALSHNTVRGAAGGGILNAELLKAKGYIK